MRMPAQWRRVVSQVAPKPVPQGKQAAGMPLKKRMPRMPLGPSETRMEGMAYSGMALVLQKSIPIDDEMEVLLKSRVEYLRGERSSGGS
jgi:hypothetical protein